MCTFQEDLTFGIYYSNDRNFDEDRQNFHYDLPRDYRMAEKFSLFTRVPYLLVWLGLAYNLKVASPSAIQGQMKRHGDKSDQKLLVKKVIRFQRQRDET